MNAKVTRASANESEGRSIWSAVNKAKTRKIVNEEFGTEIEAGRDNKHYLSFIVGNNTHRLSGHFNKRRGDFYVSLQEWNRYCGIEIGVGNQIDCEIIGIE